MAVDPTATDTSGGGPYIFFAGDKNLTMDQIRRRQAVAAALASQRRGYPKTLGEGLTYLGESIGDTMRENRLDAQERAYLNRQAGDPLMKTGPGGGAAAVTPAAATPGAAVAVPAAVPVPVPRPVTAPPRPPLGGVGPPTTFNDRFNAVGAVGTPLPNVTAQAPAAADDQPSDEEQQRRVQLAMALANRDTPGGAGVQPNPILGPGSQSDAGGDIWDARQNALGTIESSNNYGAIGVPTKYGRALGRYQVMEANVPRWTQAALGVTLTPQQFLASPEAQDAVFRDRFGRYVNQFGEEGAARAWFGGPGNVNRPDLADALGTKIGVYGQKYMNALGAAGTRASADTGDSTGGGGESPVRLAALNTGVVSDAPPIGAGGPAVSDAAEPTPTDIAPAPVRVAQLGGGGGGAPAATATTAPAPYRGIPGPLDAPTPVVVPDIERQTPREKPRPPDPSPIDPEEVRAAAIRAKYRGDADAAAFAQKIEDYGKARRAEKDKLLMEQYKMDLARWEARPETEARLKEYAQKLADQQQAAQEKQRLGGQTFQEANKAIEESHKTVDQLSTAMINARRAQQLLQQGLVFTDFGADAKRFLARAKTLYGAEDPRIAGTEEFITLMSPIVAQLRKNLVGNQNVSNIDLATSIEGAGRDLSFSRKGMIDTLQNTQDAFQRQAQAHQQMLLTTAGQDQDAQRALFGRFGLPMTDIVPERYAQALRAMVADPATRSQAIRDFDTKFSTPGLARKVLESRRGL